MALFQCLGPPLPLNACFQPSFSANQQDLPAITINFQQDYKNLDVKVYHCTFEVTNQIESKRMVHFLFFTSQHRVFYKEVTLETE